MSKMPKMNLWIDAFNSDTTFLTDEELGIYFRLIFFAWSREAYLPNDKELIYSLSKTGNSEKIEKILKLFWTYEGRSYEKGFYQKRLREEYERAVQMTENAKKSAQTRWGVVKEPDSPPNVLKLEHPNANAMRSHSERNASISKSISISKYNINTYFDIFGKRFVIKSVKVKLEEIIVNYIMIGLKNLRYWLINTMNIIILLKINNMLNTQVLG
jgi:uncharacterized protein YdaU (DUF1376 family)